MVVENKISQKQTKQPIAKIANFLFSTCHLFKLIAQITLRSIAYYYHQSSMRNANVKDNVVFMIINLHAYQIQIFKHRTHSQ
ncbi:hypothetical protein T4B_9641 [Trichinella pseudospiralis]|uniref:Uncharacterized protein n=2 Tax=Trichinella pseudospiralis TaxID=6337 RepID=A0A0V1IGM2_TRIPS|nr:hypothetical protein T4D_5159 [Trichinella pseudospiralis]KRZ21866.1 hypothetical protein T4B_9641 [Trichinella pseudospiralis]